MVKSLNELIDIAKNITPKKKIAVAGAEDEAVLKAVDKAVDNEIAEVILYGNENKIKEFAQKLNIDLSKFKVVHCEGKKEAVKKAITAVANKEADLPMKGYVKTSEILSEYLKEEYGLRTGRTINMVSVFEIPTYHKLLTITDAGMVISPTLEQKVDSINNAVSVVKKLGVELPKVAIVSAIEVVNPKIPATIDAAIITQMYRRGQIKGCIVDGPFALDNAVSKEAAEHKGIKSEVAGDADILILPDLDAGNVLYKALGFLANAKLASTIVGGKVPIVLTSRADSDEAKLLSIALTVIMAS